MSHQVKVDGRALQAEGVADSKTLWYAGEVLVHVGNMNWRVKNTKKMIGEASRAGLGRPWVDMGWRWG
jgi:hypothetical protein